jgi:hypothetical protein
VENEAALPLLTGAMDCLAITTAQWQVAGLPLPGKPPEKLAEWNLPGE